MYKLIIADDEKAIRDSLSSLVDWKELGFEIVGIFDDGEGIIECLDSIPVDVVLTDIKMTFLDGIDVARYLQEAEIPCKIVFISGHKDFELALQAIKYGVKDYILKPSKVEDVEAVFQKIRRELDEQARDMELQQKAREYREMMHPVMVEKFVENLIMGAFDDKKDIEKRIENLYSDIDIAHCSCVLAELRIIDYYTVCNRWDCSSGNLGDAIYNFVRMYEGAGYVHMIYRSKEKMKFFIIMREFGKTKEENIQLCHNQVAHFAQLFMEMFDLNVTWEVHKVFECIDQVMDNQEDMIMMAVDEEEVDFHQREQKKVILTNIMSGNIGTAQNVFKSILKSYVMNDGERMVNFVVDLFSSLSELLMEQNLQLYRSIRPYIDYSCIVNMTTAEELILYCDCVFSKMKSKEGRSECFNKDGLLNRTFKYVESHIYENISLENVADEMFISASYLGRIFKKQTGETFRQYVTRKKMEKAVELLHNPKYKVYQVGECLGYKGTRHFSKLFYNFFGYYPSQYRREVLKMAEDADEEI